MALETANAARGRWPGILERLGVDSRFLKDTHGPCPICGGKDRFRFDDKLNGNFFCSSCGAGDGFTLLQKLHGWDFKKCAAEVDAVVGNIPETSTKPRERTDEDKARAIRRVLEGAGKVVKGTAAWDWLTRRCGDPGATLGDLRNHPGLIHSVDKVTYPAMLAIMRYADGTGASVHRTYLTPDGQKAPVDPVRKIMTGFPLAGSSVRLGPVAERIGIAEGIETAISAGKRFHLPVWAAISANGLISWEPPAGVRSVLICGDCDANYTGQQAAYTLAKRLRLAGKDVEVQIPEAFGTDWNDLTQQAAA